MSLAKRRKNLFVFFLVACLVLTTTLGAAPNLSQAKKKNGFHTTSINDSIEPTKEDLFAVAVKVGLNEKEVIEVFEKMEKYIGAYFV